jgi:hypothetical protein
MNNSSGNNMQNDKAIGAYQAQCSDNQVASETLDSHQRGSIGSTPYQSDKPRVTGQHPVQQGGDVSQKTDFEQLEGDDSPLPELHPSLKKIPFWPYGYLE